MNSLIDIVIPVLVALPYLLRFRQCVFEYFQCEQRDFKRIPFFNACKYLSALPVIICGHYMGEWANASHEPDYKASDWNVKTIYIIW